ncbi:hypothetical protein ACMATS_05775 [Streptoverticillium reticulum]|uniref:hypothetical protein n=1 Tax=Streptoverticillium reticulum TaxID=1433415 RepID=UPI0039BF539E
MPKRDLAAAIGAAAANHPPQPPVSAAPAVTNTDSDGRPIKPQAFTEDLIPTPQDIQATGPLSQLEQRDLRGIHAARDNALAAEWMKGMALESCHRRKLYRGATGTRTWEEYLEEEWDGMSETEARRQMGEWKLSRAVHAHFGRPAPASHIRAIKPLAVATTDVAAAQAYARLRSLFHNDGVRVTAQAITVRVDAALGAGKPAVVLQRMHEVSTPAAIPAVPKPRPAPAPASLFRETEPALSNPPNLAGSAQPGPQTALPGTQTTATGSPNSGSPAGPQGSQRPVTVITPDGNAVVDAAEYTTAERVGFELDGIADLVENAHLRLVRLLDARHAPLDHGRAITAVNRIRQGGRQLDQTAKVPGGKP